MNPTPFFSIITPTFNHERYIAACIESVMVQTFTDWEMIVIDDSSCDRTTDLVQHFMDRNARIRLVRHDANWGLAALHHIYNQGLEISKGKWIALLEGDDCWPADKLALQYEQCRQERAIVCFGKCLLLSPHGKVLADVQQGLPRPFRRYFRDYCGSLTRPLLRRPSFIHPVTAVIQREALLRIKGFRCYPRLHLTDYPTLLELSLLGPFFGSQRLLGFYRRHRDSQSLVRIVELTAREKELAFHFQARIGGQGAGAGLAGGPFFAYAMKRSWAAETAASFWVEGRRLYFLKKKRLARAAFLSGLTCGAVHLWFGFRTLRIKAACLLALFCVGLGISPEWIASGATLRRRSLLQEALAPEEP